MVRLDKPEEFQLVCNHGPKLERENVILGKWFKNESKSQTVDGKVIDRNER